MKQTALTIIKKLHAEGFTAYYAGGAVRDMLLRKQPVDIDIVTNAKPDDIERVLKRSKIIPVGRHFGVLMVIENGHTFEVATFRSDAGYSDGRRPDAVTFTSAKEDAKRRDFTINGMLYDPTTREIIDYVSGKKDLGARLIRFIGNPTKRIKEDHLRILRAVRLKTTLSFQYHPKTYRAIVKYAKLTKHVSGERIRDEFDTMLRSPRRVEALEDLSETGLLAVTAPELEAMKGVAQPFEYHREGDVWTHTMKALKSLGPRASLDVVWAVLLHDSGKPETFKLAERIRFDGHVQKSAEIAQSILRRLRYPSDFVKKVSWLCKEHMLTGNIPSMRPAKQLKWFHHPWFSDLLQVAKADAAGSKPVDLRLYRNIRHLYLASHRSMPKLLPPLISGHDIIEVFKLKPGPEIGRLLELVHEAQLEERVKNKKEALEYLSREIRRHETRRNI